MQTYFFDVETILRILGRTRHNGVLRAYVKRLPVPNAMVSGHASLTLAKGQVISCAIRDQSGAILFKGDEALQQLRSVGALEWEVTVQPAGEAPRSILPPSAMSPITGEFRTIAPAVISDMSPVGMPRPTLNLSPSPGPVTPRPQTLLAAIPWRLPRNPSLPPPVLTPLQNNVLNLVNENHTISRIAILSVPSRRDEVIRALYELQAMGLIEIPDVEESPLL